MLELRQLPEFPVQLATNSEVRLTKRRKLCFLLFFARIVSDLFWPLGVTKNGKYEAPTGLWLPDPNTVMHFLKHVIYRI